MCTRGRKGDGSIAIRVMGSDDLHLSRSELHEGKLAVSLVLRLLRHDLGKSGCSLRVQAVEMLFGFRAGEMAGAQVFMSSWCQTGACRMLEKGSSQLSSNNSINLQCSILNLGWLRTVHFPFQTKWRRVDSVLPTSLPRTLALLSPSPTRE